jgi:N-acetyl-gamma-glutamyl-phosphate reductase
VDSKSGVSGAGRKLAAQYLAAELAENWYAYGVGGNHRHVPEIEQEASEAAGAPVRVAFTPHLLPVVRGMTTSIYAKVNRKVTTEEVRSILEARYSGEPFVRVSPEGEVPRVSSVRGTNFCDVTGFIDNRTGSLVLLSALDNLTKGASGQAVQCLNIMFGLSETEGLNLIALPPQ